MSRRLSDELRSLSSGKMLPMHMPGHKRNVCGTLAALGGKYDITEITGFDDLHEPHGILLEAQQRAAQLWGSDDTYFLVGGSTSGILAAVYSLAERGGRALAARNCHRSVYNAMELASLSPVYLQPEYNAELGFFTAVTPASVETALAENSDISLVIITSPTYEGVISDVKAIAEACHRHNVPLLVDEAHGAHLSLHGAFPAGAVEGKADAVVQSLHKTMNSLTQTALLHVSGTLADRERIRRALSLFQTSSPSYPLMTSIDECVYGADKASLYAWREAVDSARLRLSQMTRLKLFTIPGADPSKLVIGTAATSVNGSELAEMLREKYMTEVEMSAAEYIVAMTGQGDTAATLSRFCDALLDADSHLAAAKKAPLPAPPLPPRICGSYAALTAQSAPAPLQAAIGKVSAEYVFAYPPGIPVLVPGELITAEAAGYLTAAAEHGVRLRSRCGRAPEYLLTLI